MKTTAEVLRDAKTFLTPETWAQGAQSDPAKACVGDAIDDAAGNPRKGRAVGAAELAVRALMDVTDAEYIGVWNDEDGRTLEEVHGAIDRAIAAVSS